MTDREKLIALIGEIQTYGRDNSNISAVCKVSNETLADHLLANGVVVREKGEWVPVLDGGGQQCEEEIFARWWCCPVCGEENFHSKFCPDCGSDMRIEEQNRAREVKNG